MLRPLHRTSRRCFGTNWRKPGQGGASEEIQIAQALRTIRERKYPVVVEVMNACHVDWAARQLPSRRMMRDAARLWIRVLTHADLLSDTALRHQMKRASTMTPTTRQNNAGTGGGDGRRRHQVPVVALNLMDVESLKAKKLQPVMHILAGARILMDTSRNLNSDGGVRGYTPEAPKLLVCGLPNAGKSSLIYPLTKGRTLERRKKRSYHLPSVSATAGWTLGIKPHVFEVGRTSVSLMDTPGLRPPLELLSTDELAVWLATRSTKPAKGMLAGNDPEGKALCEKVVAALWCGLRRHARLSSLPFGFESPEALRSHYFEGRADAQMVQLIRACTEGEYGGMLIGDEGPPAPAHGERAPFSIDLGRTVVAMNQAAVLLRDIGAGKEDAGDAKNSVLFMPRRGPR